LLAEWRSLLMARKRVKTRAKAKAKAKASGKVRVAMIGAGSMPNYDHLPSLASFKDVEIVGICDVDPGRLNAAADKYGIEKRYDNYVKMVEETAPDAVYAVAQPEVMYPVWQWCLNQGLNLFVEKPLGSNIHQARILAYLAEKNGCITQVGFQRRHHPLVRKLRNECLNRGPIMHAVCEFHKCAIAPYFRARGHLVDDGIHAVDLVRWMCGGEVVEILSVTGRFGVPDINFVTATLRFDNGATGIYTSNWASGRRVFRVQMHSPGICAEGNIDEKGFIYTDGSLEPEVLDTREVAGSDEVFIYDGYRALNREFIDCVKAGKQPGANIAEVLKTMEVCEKILAISLLQE